MTETNWIPKFPQNKFIVTAEQLADIKLQYPAVVRCSDRRLRKWLAVSSLIAGKGQHRIRAHRAAWFMFNELQHYNGHDCNLEAQYAEMRRSGNKTSIAAQFAAWLTQYGLPGKVMFECNEEGKTFISIEVPANDLLLEIGNQFIAVGHNLYTFKTDSIEQAYSKPSPSTAINDIRATTIADASSRLYCPAMQCSDAFKHVDATAKYDEPAKVAIKQQLRSLYSDGFRPEYQPTNNTARLFAVGNSIQTLPSTIKKDLFPSWREIDLQGAWATIAASVINIKLPADLWSDLLSSSVFFQKNKPGGGGRGLDVIAQPSFLLDNSENRPPNLSDYLTKSALKPHLYAMICGIGPRQTKANLTIQFGKEISEAITNNKWWTALGTGCEQWRKQYATNNQTTLQRARTAMALKCGEIEQDLMKEVYVTSQQFPRVQIVSAEHDGCSVVCSNEAQFKTFLKLCNVAITAKAAIYGITIKLVQKTDEKIPVAALNAPPCAVKPKNESELSTSTSTQPRPVINDAEDNVDFNYELCDF